MNEQDGNPEEGFDKFVEQASRGPRRDDIERAIAGLLRRANSCSDHLRKISLLCQGAYLARAHFKDKRKLDMDTVELANVVSSCFLKVELGPEQPMVAIPWGFCLTEMNWRKYIAPWHKIDLQYFPLETEAARKYPEKPDRFGPIGYFYTVEDLAEWRALRTKWVREEIRKLPKFQAFFEMTSSLSKQSYSSMLTEFETWSICRLLTIQSRIAEQINPRSYRSFRKRRRKANRRGRGRK